MNSINLNEPCKVKLTEFGMRVMKDHLHSFVPLPDSNGYYHFQLWELFQIFGKTLWIGMLEVPFENNEIHFN